MKLKQIINARAILGNLANQEIRNARLVYWMTKFIAKTDADYKFYTDEMCKIFSEHAQHDKDNETLYIPMENVPAFNEAVERLEGIDVEDPGIRFRLSDLALDVKLSMKQMYQLIDFVDEEK